MSTIKNNSKIQPLVSPSALSIGRRSISAKRLIIVTMFVTTFLCGLAAGGLIASNRLAQHIRDRSLKPEHHGDAVLEQMNNELGLSEEQLVLLTPLVNEHFNNVSEIRRQAIPHVVKEQRRLEEQVAVHLNDAQKATWKKRCRWVREHCYGASDADGQ